MDDDERVRDLQFIRRSIEAATRYTNVPPQGQLAAGGLGLLGSLLTYLYLGAEGARDLNHLSNSEAIFLAVVWGLVLVAAGTASAWFAIRRARAHGVSAWNSLAARMFFSQVPQALAAGVLTLGLAAPGRYGLIPALWLLGYGLILFSFAYFTGRDHRRQAAGFLALGALAVFSSGPTSLLLLALGFGLINLIYGFKGIIMASEP